MNEQENLNEWIARNVMHDVPRTEARAVNPKTNGMTLWENDLITRLDVKQFCAKYPEYELQLADVWKNYTTDPAAAMDVLKLCGEKRAVVSRKQESGKWCVWDMESPEVYTCEETLELTIAQFAKKIFS